MVSIKGLHTSSLSIVQYIYDEEKDRICINIEYQKQICYSPSQEAGTIEAPGLYSTVKQQPPICYETDQGLTCVDPLTQLIELINRIIKETIWFSV